MVNQVMARRIPLSETTRGRLPEAEVIFTISKPTSHCGYIEKQCHSTVIMGEVGNVTVEILLDIGSAVSVLYHHKKTINTHCVFMVLTL